ncbi:putative phage tail protein [Anaerocolumna sp.]|uniref:putative phage tail protein n=1 Tax=Anaerocolumna sp. TaxID=2041569 RepID=UPI0028A72753|nr:putative phage tail protein [Anaerocolumna sp.]
MDREINLIEYLPGVLREVKEFKAFAKAENPEAIKLWEELENVLDDQFVNESTLNGVKRWESILGIKALDTDTLSDRKFRILSRLNEQLPYTYKNLESQLSLLCGENGYKLHLDNSTYELIVKVALTAKKKFAEVGNLLDRVVPCNIVISLILMYNQHSTLSQFTHAHLSQYTHNQLREEVLS